MSTCIIKSLYIEKPKRPSVWNGGASPISDRAMVKNNDDIDLLKIFNFFKVIELRTQFCA